MKKNYIVFIFWNIMSDSVCKGFFEYTQSGQRMWAKNFPKCAGNWQSPIIITASRSVSLPLSAVEMVGYHDFLPPPFLFLNNGHTVSMKIKNEFSRKRSPYIFGGPLNENEEYELESFHFHWGLKNSRGSEHVLHGTRYPMEMHLIHRNMKYPDLETALQYDDGLAVLGIFFHLEEEDNSFLRPLISLLPEIQWVNTEIQLNRSLILSWLLPKELDTYYTYKGSLTTPPCNEVVTWIVFTSTIPISFKQMRKFRLLSTGKGILADNFRSIQDLGQRKIYVRRTQSVLFSGKEIADFEVSSLKWNW